MIIRCGRPSDRSRFNNIARHIAHEPLIFPDISPIIPILFSLQSTISHHQRWIVCHVCLTPKLCKITIASGDIQGVFESRMSISHHSHLLVKLTSTLWHNHQSKVSRGLKYLLSLLASWLVVTLNRYCTHIFQTFKMKKSILIAINSSKSSRRVSTIQHCTR